MARPKKDELVDLGRPHELTAGLIDRLECPAGKGQAFLRDVKAPGLRVRVTETGAKSFVFEAKLDRKTIRRTIGDVRAWTIEDARAKARVIRVNVDAGVDPRELDREQGARKAQEAAAAIANAVTVGEAWTAYLKERRSKWGDRHYQDHLRLAQEGGKPAKRGTRGRGVTVPGPIYPLLSMKLIDLSSPMVEAWAESEAKTRPTYGRLAWRCLKSFLNWCGEQPDYRHLAPVNVAKTKRSREAFGKPAAKSDVLQREQLRSWFAAVTKIGNPTISAAVQVMLLTGARPGEVLRIKWEDINSAWRSITIRDKVEGERMVPLTRHVAHLLRNLPKRNEFVFASLGAKGGMISFPGSRHSKACKVAGIEGLTLHGLRRSFSSLTEWLEIPAGVVAQIMGHKPTATAERHYKVRPLELLRRHHERIEAWILKQAGIPMPAKSNKGLRVIEGGKQQSAK